MAGFSIFALLVGLIALWGVNYVVSSAFSFWRNLQIAKKSGLPYMCRVVFEFNYAFLAIQPALTKLIDRVPRWLDPTGYLDFYKKDWRMLTRHDKYKQLGDVFWNVSPGLLMLEVGDADVTTELTTRRTDFVKPRWVFENIRLFGPNIIEADEQDWKRHRRVLGPHYSDGLHTFVWTHACKLAREMRKTWEHQDTYVAYSPGAISREARSMGSLAMRVIVGAAFNRFIPFDSGKDTDIGTQGATYFAEQLEIVMGNLMTIMIFPKILIAISSNYGRKVAKAMDEVRQYMNEMLVAERNEEKPVASDGKSDENTDRSTMLRGIASAVVDGPPGPGQLAYSEAIGNIFLMALAGSATTGDTLHFSVVLLALHQDVQKWVLEELDECLQQIGDDWTYQQAFGKLKRINHVMMETLRLYPVTPVLPKWTENKSQMLTVDGQKIFLPPKTVTTLSFPAIHYNPKYWGADASEFRPQRWEEFEKGPKDGSFVPFSRGARSCLGKRFSESEFTAVLSTLLRDQRVELAVGEGESLESVKRRTQQALDKSGTYMTLSVGDCVPLKWVKR